MRRLALLLSLVALAACETPINPDLIVTPRVPFLMSDLTVGSGPAAENGDTVSVAYTGWVYDISRSQNQGAEIDSATADNPFVFVLGAGQVIAGWDMGVLGMQVGGIRRLVIPPELAYGDEGTETIGPGTTLLFDIELLAIN